MVILDSVCDSNVYPSSGGAITPPGCNTPLKEPTILVEFIRVILWFCIFLQFLPLMHLDSEVLLSKGILLTAIEPHGTAINYELCAERISYAEII